MLICPCNDWDNLLFISSHAKRTAKIMQQMRIDSDAVGFLRLSSDLDAIWKQLRKMRLQIYFGNLLINSHISYVLHGHGHMGRSPWLQCLQFKMDILNFNAIWVKLLVFHSFNIKIHCVGLDSQGLEKVFLIPNFKNIFIQNTFLRPILWDEKWFERMRNEYIELIVNCNHGWSPHFSHGNVTVIRLAWQFVQLGTYLDVHSVRSLLNFYLKIFLVLLIFQIIVVFAVLFFHKKPDLPFASNRSV